MGGDLKKKELKIYVEEVKGGSMIIRDRKNPSRLLNFLEMLKLQTMLLNTVKPKNVVQVMVCSLQLDGRKNFWFCSLVRWCILIQKKYLLLIMRAELFPSIHNRL